MPLEAYASFCAELADSTNDAAAVFAKYHVSGEPARAALDQEWQTRFDAHADTKAKWQKLFDACRARLLQQRR
jgi:putative alpha-1,2-mannosidase